jgi:hypothetical protein
MGHPMPAQHTSVVLRPHFNPRQTLLAFAMAAVLALGAGVVILANDADQVASTNRIAPAVQQSQTQQSQTQLPAGTRFDGGPDEGTRGLAAQPQLPAGTRFDGGPDEGTRGLQSYYESPNARSSYQPAPADGTKARAGGPSMLPQGPGAR